VKTLGTDTNVLITLKLHRQPGFNKARSCLENCLDGKIKLFIPSPAFLETEWVLRSYYEYPKEKIVEYFEEIIAIENVISENKDEIKIALNLFKQYQGISFTDSLLITQIQNRNYDFLTFDKALDKLFKSIN